MGYATITNLEQGLNSSHRFFELIKQDSDTVSRLTNLYGKASVLDLEKHGEIVQTSFESILNSNKRLSERLNVSNENKVKDVLKRIKDIILNAIKWIMDRIRKVGEYIRDLFAKTEFRRKQLIDDFNKLLKLTKKQKGHYKPVIFKQSQLAYVVVNNSLPDDMSKNVKELELLSKDYRTSEFIKIVRDLSKVTDTKGIPYYDSDVFEKIRDDLLKISDVSAYTKRKDFTGMNKDILVNLIGNRQVVFKNRISGQAPDKDNKHGLSVTEIKQDTSNLGDKITYFQLNNKKDVEQLIKYNIDLIGEAGALTNFINDFDKDLKSLGKSLDKAAKSIVNDTSKFNSPQHFDNTKSLIDLANNAVYDTQIFPGALYTHILRVGSSQLSILKSVVSSGD